MTKFRGQQFQGQRLRLSRRAQGVAVFRLLPPLGSCSTGCANIPTTGPGCSDAGTMKPGHHQIRGPGKGVIQDDLLDACLPRLPTRVMSTTPPVSSSSWAAPVRWSPGGADSRPPTSRPTISVVGGMHRLHPAGSMSIPRPGLGRARQRPELCAETAPIWLGRLRMARVDRDGREKAAWSAAAPLRQGPVDLDGDVSVRLQPPQFFISTFRMGVRPVMMHVWRSSPRIELGRQSATIRTRDRTRIPASSSTTTPPRTFWPTHCREIRRRKAPMPLQQTWSS